MGKKVLVILSGCGFQDGTEIHEAVSTLLAIDMAGATAVCAAPDMPSTQCVDHYRKKRISETRNALVEAARIARGKIIPLSQVQLNDIDAIVLPGGMGAASTLCDFALTANKVTIEPTLKQLLTEAHNADKPLGFICIAPVIAATLFGSQGVKYTIGAGSDIGQMIIRLSQNGAVHIPCQATDIVVDEKLKIVSTPAYMLAQRVSEVAEGVRKLVDKLLDLTR